MNTNIDNEIKKTKIKYKYINILTVLGYILTYSINININYIIIVIKILLSIANFDLYLQDIILTIIKLSINILPIFIIVNGRIQKKEVLNQLKELEYYKRMHPTKKQNNSIQLDADLDKINDIIIRFKNLPRNRQMEILNYIKGNISSKDDNICKDISLLDNNNLEYLQDELEDILFPNFEQTNNYSKKLKKE